MAKKTTKGGKLEKIQKVFVLDTNVILHDSKCIDNFQEHDIVIPMTVIEELDTFKKGSEGKNFHSRHSINDLDIFSLDEKVFNGGTSLGKGKGTIQVKICSEINDRVKKAFAQDIKDHRILSIILDLIQAELEDKKRNVVFVTKDVALRVKARSLGIKAEDYKTDKIVSIDNLYTGKASAEVSQEVMSSLYKGDEVDLSDLDLSNIKVYPNMHMILTSDTKSALVSVDSEKKKIKRIEKKRVMGIEPRNAEQIFSLDLLMDPEITLVTLSGKAGTGKTLLALAPAIEQFSKKKYDAVYLARPIVELSNRSIGFLPGDAGEKVSPYMLPLFDNLSVIKNSFKPSSKEFIAIEAMLKDQKMIITPLAYIRGRSLNNIFFIIDEAQNLTPHEVKTIITRAGTGTKIVFTGDPQQIDSPYLDSTSNGLSYLIEKFKGQSLYGHVTLVKGERSDLAELASDIL